MLIPHVHVNVAYPMLSTYQDQLWMNSFSLTPPHPQLYQALQQKHAVWRKNGCYHPDVIVTIHPDDNNFVIMQPDESIKCYHPAR
jgi:hypothetical protein